MRLNLDMHGRGQAVISIHGSSNVQPVPSAWPLLTDTTACAMSDMLQATQKRGRKIEYVYAVCQRDPKLAALDPCDVTVFDR